MSDMEVLGGAGFGELSDGLSQAVSDPFAALLERPDGQILYLVEVYPFDPQATTTLQGSAPFGSAAFGEYDISVLGDVQPVYLSNLGFTTEPSDSVPDAHFAARVDNPMQFDVSIMAGDEFSSSAPSYGSIVIANGDGGMDDLIGYSWLGRRVVVKAGGLDFSYADFATVFDGAANGIESDDENLRLTIRDNRIKTDQLLVPSTYSGLGGVEGGTDLATTVKPLCFGEVKNIEPVLVDAANLIYQFHDGAAQAVDRVLDSGVALTGAGDVADITAASVSAGQYKTQLSGGYIKLGSTPAGRITADVKGDATGGSYVNTAGDILNRMLTQRMGINNFSSGEIDGGSISRLNTSLSGAMGIYIPDRATGSDVLDALINPCGAYWTFTRQGVLTVGVIDDPGTETLEIGEDDVDERGIEVEAIPPSWRISVGYAPVDIVQREDEMAGSATAADRALLGEPYRYTTYENSSVRAQNSHAVERTFNTRLVNKTDADALLARLARIFAGERRMYRVPAWKMLFRVYIGDTVNQSYPRYGLDDGVNLLVVGVSEDLEAGTTVLQLWG